MANMEAEIRDLKKQILTLQQKVNAKTDTIVRLGQDLQISENEKNVLDARVKTLERNLERAERESEFATASEANQKLQYSNERQDLLEDLNRFKKENQILKREKQELADEKAELRKDCKTFRQTIARYEVEKLAGTARRNTLSEDEPSTSSLHIHEKLQTKYKQIESDLQTVLGIKEELLIERDELQQKVSRLSNELSYLLNGDSRRIAEDIDTLVAENRFLKARLNTAQEESESIKSTLEKYKTMAESVTSQKTSPKSEKVDSEKTSVAVINMKQIRELLASHSIELDDSDYRAITTILLDLCNDKQMALAHLRKANKVLGTRLHEVETKLSNFEVRSRTSSPRHENNVELQVPSK
ncbi:unnamed protein product [Caenorhabditis angaria]|uniref:Uncharacterized protein n=1 Tax=Caenorhabditis angaria TaxID=860376 RepID=A0A9P1NAB7_9PELO|nr:unnamed protein product [Caenorhabditis angaria]